MQRYLLIPLFTFGFWFLLNGQTVFQLRPEAQQSSERMDEQFSSYHIVTAPVEGLSDWLQRSTGEETRLELLLGEMEGFVMDIRPEDLRAMDYQLIIAEAQGSRALPKARNKTFRGHLARHPEDQVRFTVDHNFLYGYIERGQVTYYIEPAWLLDPALPEGAYVWYEAAAVTSPEVPNSCGTRASHSRNLKPGPAPDLSRQVMQCYSVGMGLAADYQLYSALGSATAVENFMLGVLNNVGTNYDNEFTSSIEFVVNGTFISTCPGCDPWTNANEALDVLNSFTNWGNSGGLGFSYSLATLWTGRNLNEETIGIAWVGGLCTSGRYNVCERFLSNAALLRVLQAHEIGHNFSASHDPDNSNTIMAPSVNTSNDWSSNAVSDISNYTNVQSGVPDCFGGCGAPAAPPIAEIGTPVEMACPGSYIQFVDESQNNPTSWSWSFPGGVPSSSNVQNPSVEYPLPGSYPVTLTVSNAAGSSTTALSANIEVNGPPEPFFLYDIDSFTVAFGNLTDDFTTIQWSFGDGGTSEADSPTHTFSQPGTYTVTLSAQNECGTAAYTEEITITPPPVASFYEEALSGCEPVLIQFINTSSFADTFFWTFENGHPATSTDPDPICSFSEPGHYAVTLIAVNDLEADTLTQMVTVSGSPQSSFLADNTPGEFTVAFQNNSLDAFAFEWDFGDGSPPSMEFFPSHTYDTTGVYTVTLIASNDCGSDTSSQVVAIVLPPSADFSVSQDSACIPYTVNPVDLTEGRVAERLWIASGAAPDTSTLPDPSFTYDSAGVYEIVLQVTNAAGTSFDTATIALVSPPVGGFLINDTLGSSNIALENTSAGANTFSWHFGDGNTSGECSPAHTYSQDGEYIISLVSENTCGRDTVEQIVNITTPPAAAIGNADTTACAVFEFSPVYAGSSNAASIYWWAPGATEPEANTLMPAFSYEVPGVYPLVLQVSNAAGTSSDTIQVMVEGIPTAAFDPDYTIGADSITLMSLATGEDSLRWDFGDGSTSEIASPVHQYEEAGVYTVQLVVWNECGVDSLEQDIEIITPPSAGFVLDANNGCAPFTVQVTPANPDAEYDYLYMASGAQPSVSSLPDPSFTFSAPGTYQVIQSVTNEAGSSTDSITITVGEAPQANFLGTVGLGSTVLAIQNTSIGADSYHWDFGDGAVSTTAGPAHSYAADGIYTVTLIAVNACGSDTSTQVVNVVTPPSATAVSDTVQGCAPLTFSPEGIFSENAAEILWIADGAIPDTAFHAMPSFTFETPGTYTVYLQAGNAAGVSIDSVIVEVQGLPFPAFSAVVTDFTVELVNSSEEAPGYNWSFGDGNTSNEENPLHTYALPGDYPVTLTAINECGAADTTVLVSIALPSPTAAFETEDTVGCAPFEVSFFNTSLFGGSFEWSFPGGDPAFSAAENPTVVYGEAGTYDVRLVVSNDSGTDTLEISEFISIGEAPEAGFEYSIDVTTVSFTNTATGANDFLWFFGDGNNSSLPNPVHHYTGSGTYLTSFIAKNECGTDTLQQVIEIAGLAPEPVIVFGNTPEGCAPFSLELYAQNLTNTPVDTWTWLFPGGEPGAVAGDTVAVSYSVPGTYTLSLIGTNVFGTDTLTLMDTVEVQMPPDAAFSASINEGDVTFLNASGGADLTLEWNFGDGNTSTEANPGHIYAESGQYLVTLTVSNACGSDTMSETLDIVITSAKDWEPLGHLEVFPNPNRGHFAIKVAGEPAERLHCTLYNVVGRQLRHYESTFRTGEWQQTVDGSHLPGGVYLLEVRVGQQRAYRKIVIE